MQKLPFTLALISSIVFSIPAALADNDSPTTNPPATPAPKSTPKFGGSATCTIKKANGEPDLVSCQVSFIYTSSSEAENALKAAINSKITQSGGTRNGEISVSVSKEFW